MAAQKREGGETTIAMGVRVEGDFVSEGDVVIEGDVIGTVKTKGALRVGNDAHITANVQAQSAVILGFLKGNLVVTGRLELGEHSVIEGDVTTQVLSVAPGARVNGKLSMGGDASKEMGASEAFSSEDAS